MGGIVLSSRGANDGAALSVEVGKAVPSVDRRVRRHGGEERVLAALAPQYRRPQALGVEAEDLLARRGRVDDPRLLLEPALELPRRPAGVAGVHAGAAYAAGDVAELARLVADEAEVAFEQDAGDRGVVELGEHDHGVRGDRAAEEDRRVVLG